jgi:hypothetical protein
LPVTREALISKAKEAKEPVISLSRLVVDGVKSS